MVLGAHVVLCMTEPDFSEKMFYPQNGENGPTKPRILWMYRKVQFLFLVLYFFISVVYNESLYYCNSCMLEHISYLGKFWFLRYSPKCSWPIKLQDFLINRRTLKLAVSHKQINEINWFLVCPSNSFPRNVSLDFGTMVDNSNIEKLTEPFFPWKFIFCPNLGNRAQNGPKIGFWGFLKNFVMLVFLGNNL